MKFQIQADPAELAAKSFDLVQQLVSRLAPHDARLARLDELLKSASSGGRGDYGSYLQVGHGMQTQSNIGTRAYFDPSSVAQTQLADARSVPQMAEALIPGMEAEAAPAVPTILDSGALNPMSPYVAGTAAAVTGQIEDVIGYPAAQTVDQVVARTAELTGGAEPPLSENEPAEYNLEGIEAYATREGVRVDDAWFNSPFVLKGVISKRLLGQCELRGYDKFGGRVYAVKLPNEEPRAFKSLNAACDWTWVKQRGFDTVDAWKQSTGKTSVPSGGGLKFWGIRSEPQVAG